MTKATKDELPIGYWLKRVDNLLTDQINKAQTVNGVSRSDWQVLNMLNEAGSASKEQIFESMRTFVDASSLDGIITRLSGVRSRLTQRHTGRCVQGRPVARIGED